MSVVIRQAVAVRSLDHCVLPVMDLWRSERFYTEALGGRIFQKLGMTYDELAKPPTPVGSFVKVGVNHIGLFVQHRTPVKPPASIESGYPCCSFAVAESDMDDVARAVVGRGGSVGAERDSLLGKLQARSVRGTDSEGNAIELVADPRGRQSGERVLGLARLHAESKDLAQTADFYAKFVGAELQHESSDAVVLGLPSSQLLVFHKVDEFSPAMVGPFRGRHFAFHVDDDTFHAIVARLREAGIPEGDVRGAEPGGQAYTPERVGDELGTYFNDPSGLRLQLINEDSAAAAAGRDQMRYVAA
jgi:catechol 2,3-dioxygenase-like lactoylglutathione lyase family enzyme